MKRGEVYLADLTPRSGSEQQGRRPVIVLSHDAFNQASTWRSIIVIPVSSSPRQAVRGPTVIPLPKGTAGLAQDSVAVCHQITTLDRSKLTQRLGELPQNLLSAIEVGLKAAVDMR